MEKQSGRLVRAEFRPRMLVWSAEDERYVAMERSLVDNACAYADHE